MGNINLANMVTAAMKAEQRKAALLQQFSIAIQQLLDGKAAERRYDSIQTAVTFRDDPNPIFAAESQALFAWRSAVWSYSGAELDKVMAGERVVPEIDGFLEEIILECPFAWPEGQPI